LTIKNASARRIETVVIGCCSLAVIACVSAWHENVDSAVAESFQAAGRGAYRVVHDIDGTMARQFRDVRRCVNFEIDDKTVVWRCWKVDSATEEKREVDKKGDGVDVHLRGKETEK
jgi:hypothetical protein